MKIKRLFYRDVFVAYENGCRREWIERKWLDAVSSFLIVVGIFGLALLTLIVFA